ncbi:MAG: hypothetical protein JWR38_6009 [Mucilaginibacter sp.]|nr:hypothetical protein [Mucilaginibacter sp.]
MIYIFVDANVLLSFYAYTSDDIAQLEKLVQEVKAGNVKLLVSDQLKSEVWRNREAKIAETIKNFYSDKDVGQFPNVVQAYPEFQQINAAAASYKTLRAVIRKKLDQDIKDKTLPADKILSEMLTVGVTETTTEIIEAARNRVDRGNPPGKKGSLGDAINWEHLLKHCPINTDVYFVTNDKDYMSPVDQSRFSQFLIDEWREANGGEVFFFRSLRELLKQVIPQIELSAALAEVDWSWADEDDEIRPVEFPETVLQHLHERREINPVEEAVSNLEGSASFRGTHASIERMPDVRLLHPDQIKRLFRAAVQNSQIYSIATDDDVSVFFKNLYQTWGELIDPEVKEEFEASYM